MSTPTVISTFSGPGGSSTGYERANFDVRASLDCAPDGFADDILTTYKINHPDTDLIAKDAREATPAELLERAGVSVGELDVLDGSPPCSPFSSANTKVNWGDHKSGTLFDRYAYFVDELQPKAFVAENVPDLAQGKTKGYYKLLCDELREAGPGYDLTVQKIDAAYLGAPHHRRRLMFIGTRADLPDPPTIEPKAPPTTVREAWEGLDRDEDAVRRARKRVERSDNFDNYRKMNPGQSLDDVVEGAYGFTHHRLEWDKPAPTMLAGGSSNKILHPDDTRDCTPQEYARLTGLPDSYELPPSFGSAKECAVRCLPPILLETIADELHQHVLS